MTARTRTAHPYRDIDVIDARAPRFNQATVGVVSLIAVLTGWWPLLGAAGRAARHRPPLRPPLLSAVRRLLRARPAPLWGGRDRGLTTAEVRQPGRLRRADRRDYRARGRNDHHRHSLGLIVAGLACLPRRPASASAARCTASAHSCAGSAVARSTTLSWPSWASRRAGSDRRAGGGLQPPTLH